MAENKDIDLTPVLYLGTAAIVYFGVIRPITNTLGITTSAADQQTKNENAAASKTNGWDPNFYKTYKGSKTLFSDATVTSFAKKINNAWGYFYDDVDAIYGVFRQLGNLLELSQLCDKYFQLYGENLLARIQEPWYMIHDGITEAQFNVIAKIVNALPVN